MPLLILLRILLGLMSLAVLASGSYFLWSWWHGHAFVDLAGVEHRIRDDDWRLWLGLGLLAWSAFGRLLVSPLITHSDETPTRPERQGGEARTLPAAGGGSLYVELLGPPDAPPIVLTHGWGLDSTIWYYAKRDLARRFRVIVWDLPGLGKSKAGKGAVDLANFAADLQAVLALAERPPVLVGHSIGGMTIQTLARDRPEAFQQVAGVILLNTTYTNPLRTMVFSPLARALQRPLIEPMMHLAIWLAPFAWLGAWQSYFSGSAHMANRLGFGRYVTRSQLEHTTLLATRNSPAAQARGNLAMFHWDASGALSNLKLPILVIGGELDIVTLMDASTAIADSSRDARLERVDGVNHMGFLERAEIYNSAIANFTDSLQPRAAPGERPPPGLSKAWR